ncbi:MAG: DUF99 family protein [Candidatus Micrarchaeota archaeon]
MGGQRQRILAIDDSPFSRRRKNCACVGILSNGDVVEGVLTFNVTRDGDDATTQIIKTLRKSRFRKLIRLLMIHSVTLAGLNVVDIREIHSALNIPVLCITREKPSENSLAEAIKKVFKDGESRSEKLGAIEKAGEIKEHNKLHFQSCGIKDPMVFSILDSYKSYPWNLRLAHLIASAITDGESHGKA